MDFAFEIIAVFLDIVLFCNAILLFASSLTTKDIRIKIGNISSCSLFILLESVKTFVEIWFGKSYMVSNIIVAIYFIIIFVTIYSINKNKPKDQNPKREL